MLDFTAKAAGCTCNVFSKIDLRKWCHQTSFNPEDVQRTAITNHFGLFKRMPFGLRNAAASFQLHVDRSIRDCQAAFAWVNDIVICSRTHKEPVGQVWQALQENRLVINSEKGV
jgi:hypothetical protein